MIRNYDHFLLKLAVSMTAGKTFVMEEFLCDQEMRYAQHIDEHM